MEQGGERERERAKYQLRLVRAEKPPLELKELPLSPLEVHPLVLLTLVGAFLYYWAPTPSAVLRPVSLS